jgi:predicted CopG family antitoxin
MSASMTTISLTRETKDLLAKFGKKDESYDDVVRRLLGEVNGSRRGRGARE